jgi:hypothetical protein
LEYLQPALAFWPKEASILGLVNQRAALDRDNIEPPSEHVQHISCSYLHVIIDIRSKYDGD